MELSEATRLADTFITRAVFKLHSLPLRNHGQQVVAWGKTHGSHLPARQALEEMSAHLDRFAVWSEVDRAHGRSLHLTISALSVQAEAGRCPKLIEDRCGIYEARPLTCRTVPLHYSRPLSTLGAYLDGFVAMPDYRCAIGPEAPVVLRGETVADSKVAQARWEAAALAEADRAWKQEIGIRMRRPDAWVAGLPSYETVLAHHDAGAASSVSMLVVWRIARTLGLLTPAQFDDLCRRQSALLRAEITRVSNPANGELHAMLAEYDQEAAAARRAVLDPLVAARGSRR